MGEVWRGVEEVNAQKVQQRALGRSSGWRWSEAFQSQTDDVGFPRPQRRGRCSVDSVL